MIVPSTAPRHLSVPLRERFGLVALSAGVAAVLLAFTACGYRLTGHAGALPGVQTIGIPTFVNRTSRPQLEQRITEHVIDEFTTRGRARIVPSEEGAQAVLKGTILSYTLNPVAISELGRATRYEILITAHVTLSEVATEKVLWEDDHFLFKRQYDVAADPQSFVDQEIVAIDDVATDFARSVVTSILEGF
ncbi:MAG TPA: LptE family protein [Candidatus Polarisedimenticolia bacterium]|nr:LptE family protein [Candidatus Polarisedimenticolia bacterium]